MVKLITPNWHVILIHYPMALLTAGLLIELFSFLWRRSGFRAAGRWMILIGTLSLLPTATSGLYAFRDAVSQQSGGTWADVKARSTMPPEGYAEMRSHIIDNSLATGLFLLGTLTWIASSDNWRRKLHVPLLLVLLMGCGFIMLSAWHGGEAVYRVGIAREVGTESKLETAVPEMRNPATENPEQGMTVAHPTTPKEKLEWALPPIQVHVVMAGMVIAFSLVALALSIRKMTHYAESAEPENWFETHNVTETTVVTPPAASASGDAIARTERTVISTPPDPALAGIAPLPSTPASRFWLLATLLGLMTATGGLWLTNNWTLAGIKNDMSDPGRDFWHIVFGVTIALVPLILAATTRWAPRGRIVLGTLSLLLLFVVAAQIWVGILLMYDSPEGGLTRFNPPATHPAAAAASVIATPASAPTTLPAP